MPDSPATPRSPAVIAAQIVAAGLGAYLIYVAIVAGSTQPLFGPDGSASVLANEPWGWVTIVDLYIGFVFVGMYIGALERRWTARASWWVALFVTGNAATMAYIVWRGFRARTLSELLIGAAPAKPVS